MMRILNSNAFHSDGPPQRELPSFVSARGDVEALDGEKTPHFQGPPAQLMNPQNVVSPWDFGKVIFNSIAIHRHSRSIESDASYAYNS